MNLISCENCGVVLDTSKIPAPELEIEDEEGHYSIDFTKARWSNHYDEFIPLIPCPVCKAMIAHKDGTQ